MISLSVEPGIELGIFRFQSKVLATPLPSLHSSSTFLLLSLKGQIVSIQCTNNGRWNTTGQIIETLPHNQYQIRVDGSGRITLRNRRFLRKLETPVTPHPILSPSNGTPILERNGESKTPALQTTDSEKAPQPPLPLNSTNQPAVTTQAKPARALSHLLPHNKPGLKELIPPERPLPMGEGGDIEHQ